MAKRHYYEITNKESLEFVVAQLQPGSRKILPFQAKVTDKDKEEILVLELKIYAPSYHTGGRYEGICFYDDENCSIVINIFDKGLPQLFID